MKNIEEIIKALDEKEVELKAILDTMDVPEGRKQDHKWLLRNLAIRNSQHIKFEEAMKIIKMFYFLES